MKKAKKWARALFRYPLSDMYMFLSLMLSFIAFYLGFSITASVFDRNVDQENYSYKNTYEAEIEFFTTEKVELLEIFEGCKGNITIRDVEMSSEAEEAMQLVDVVLVVNEDFIYQYTNGKKVKASDYSKKSGALIGKEQKNKIITKNGVQYISLNGELYQVAGYTGVSTSDIFDYLLILDYKSLGELSLERLYSANKFLFHFESNYNDMYASCSKMQKNAESLGIDVVAQPISIYIADDYGSEKSESVMYYTLFVFCIINCVIAAEFWLSKRWREIAIRNIFGEENKNLFSHIYYSLLRIGGISAFFCFAIQWGVRLSGGKILGISIRLSFSNLLISVAVLIGVTLVITLNLMRKVNKISAIEALAIIEE